MRHWYAVLTKPRQEYIALAQLERQSYEACLPLARERKRARGQYVWQIVPLFPRYLFVSLEIGRDNTAPIRSTIGCCGLVRIGLQPARLPEGVVEALRDRSNADGCVSLAESDWHCGQRLQVSEGPFAGIEAIFQARSSEERVRVLLQWLGGVRDVELPDQILVAAD